MNSINSFPACKSEPNSDISDSQCSRESGSYSSAPSMNAAQPIQHEDCMAASSVCNTSGRNYHHIYTLHFSGHVPIIFTNLSVQFTCFIAINFGKCFK